MKAVIMLSKTDRNNLTELFDREHERIERFKKQTKQAIASGDETKAGEYRVRVAFAEQKICAMYEVLDALGIDDLTWLDESETGIRRQD